MEKHTENIGIMEPLMPEEGRYPELVDLAAELMASTRSLATRLHPRVAESIGDLVRSMNCCYSNLIEGHDTHPRDIDRALASHFSQDPRKCALQLEAKAHIEVQQLIDKGQMEFSTGSNFIQWIHEQFCRRLPDELLWSVNPDNHKKIPVVPGQFRTTWVQVGRNIPPSPEDISAFLKRFSQGYDSLQLNKINAIIAVAASHHRLLWIHPFLDGNGRVTRLFSHAFLRHIGVGSRLWSISRGLARRVDEYKRCLAEADSERRGDLDGRGHLSAQALQEFCQFFLRTCLDQVSYMSSLIEPIQLSQRIELYINEQITNNKLPKGSLAILREVLFSGEMERGRAPMVTGYKERQARTVLNALIKAKLLISNTPKGPVQLNFPIDIVERWFPKLYPGSIGES